MIVDIASRVLELIKRRKYAYQMVFDKNNKYTQFVLSDLARFCRAHESTFDKDSRKHAVLEGRREVWLKIQEQLNLTEPELFELHKIKSISQGDKK